MAMPPWAGVFPSSSSAWEELESCSSRVPFTQHYEMHVSEVCPASIRPRQERHPWSYPRLKGPLALFLCLGLQHTKPILACILQVNLSLSTSYYSCLELPLIGYAMWGNSYYAWRSPWAAHLVSWVCLTTACFFFSWDQHTLTSRKCASSICGSFHSV
jgi:hypothetical protein